ncbi:flagellar protein FliT [Salirhabdus sp. Marseille-P4669]|uniref:flagellar protein FliT n=1 Tax=Salirhabdus sp. Marseille-P4669 TaxID=2042310 RepID=UPI000C7AF12F|nr:flagellar protein FliT [Salirhabdus sp. Marseille-P4669]
MSAVIQLHEKTANLHEQLKQDSTEKDREELISEITIFVNERDELLKAIKPPFTEKEMNLGKEILVMDQQIQEVLQRLLSGLKGSMKDIQNKKRNNRKYVNPYQNVSTVDGMFFDKKN